MDFNFDFTHIKYLINNECHICTKIFLKEDTQYFKYGEAYTLKEVLYAETKEDKRKKIWVVSSKNPNIHIHVDINDFGDESDLRETKIKKIYE